jgi:hypothetical protein
VDNLVAQLLGLRVGGVDVTDVDRLHRVFGCSAVAGHHAQLGGLGVGIAEARDPAEVEAFSSPRNPTQKTWPAWASATLRFGTIRWMTMNDAVG